MTEQSRPVRYYGTNVRVNLIEMLSANYAQVNLLEMQTENAHRAVHE